MNVEIVKTGYLKENCYILTKNNNCITIDPGDDQEKIKEIIGNKKVLAILVTHYHFDHVGALEELKKYYDVKVIDYNSYDIEKIGDFSFLIIRTPGHKEDSVTYYFKEYKKMFVGDFIFRGTIGRCDLEGGNIKDMKNSLNIIKKYDKDVKLYPGHGDITTIGYELEYNPYLRGE